MIPASTLVPDWTSEAACAGTDPREFFPAPGSSAKAALKVCEGCPTRVACLQLALDTEQPYARHGVWGGTTPADRELIARRQLVIG